MDMAVAKLRNVIIALASLTLEDVKIGPNLPIDLPPGDSISLSDEGDEFLQVPSSVNHMLGSDLAVVINIRFTFMAVQDLALTHTEKLVAVGTFVQIIPFFF